MGPVGWTVVAIGALIAFGVFQLIYFSVVLRWEDERTVGLEYYGLRPAERDRFKRALRAHARFLAPLLRLGGRFIRIFHDRILARDG